MTDTLLWTRVGALAWVDSAAIYVIRDRGYSRDREAAARYEASEIWPEARLDRAVGASASLEGAKALCQARQDEIEAGIEEIWARNAREGEAA